MRRRCYRLSPTDKDELLNLLAQRRELTDKKLMARFKISRATLWRSVNPVPRGAAKQFVSKRRKPLETAEIIFLADRMRELQ